MYCLSDAAPDTAAPTPAGRTPLLPPPTNARLLLLSTVDSASVNSASMQSTSDLARATNCSNLQAKIKRIQGYVRDNQN